ncbi:hypothetical protein F5Y19DRAFT_475412 [Xylariaceae sp. FL1651]|nr:hypothetical protein F5Y19DRAFT_475412 [Xylariaceae sp. FL1651]
MADSPDEHLSGPHCCLSMAEQLDVSKPDKIKALGKADRAIAWEDKQIHTLLIRVVAEEPVAPSMSASSFLPLTTTFTPPSECTSWYIDECTGTDCYAEAFPTSTGIYGSNRFGDETSYVCFPDVTLSTGSFANGEVIYTLEVYNYSPGLYCPVGMTTATSVPLLDGVFCCPVACDFREVRREGVAPEQDGYTTISVYAPPISLGGQKILSKTSSFTTSSSMSTSRPETAPLTVPTGSKSTDSNNVPVGVKIGAGIRVPFGVLLLLYLAVIFIKRHRRNQSRNVKSFEQIEKLQRKHTGKPGLEGHGTRVHVIKAELDPLATRAELEAPFDEAGAGFHVQKPELEGTSARRGTVGGFVWKKSELDGVT